jgi:hypothetical protein
MTHPILPAGCCLRWLAINATECSFASRDQGVTNGEVSPIQIMRMEKHLQCWHRHQIRHILYYMRFPYWITSYNQHCHRELSAISTLAAQPMIVSDRQHPGINHPAAVLSVTGRWVVNVKSLALKRIPQSTTAYSKSPTIGKSSDTSGRMAIWAEVIGRHDLASVIILLISVCFSMS